MKNSFYVFWPWVVRKISERRLVLVCSLLIGGGLATRIIWIALGRSWPGTYHFSLAALLALFLIVNPFYPSHPAVATVGHTLLAFCAGAFIVTAVSDQAPRWLVSPWLRTFGKYSYGIYVWHWPLQQVLLLFRPSQVADTYAEQFTLASAFLAVGLAGSFALGWLSYEIYEKRFLRLKRHFLYGRA